MFFVVFFASEATPHPREVTAVVKVGLAVQDTTQPVVVGGSRWLFFCGVVLALCCTSCGGF